MAVELACPDEKVLARLLLGEIPPEETASLGAHLQGCEHCAAFLQQLHVTDSLLTQIRRAARIPDPPAEPGVEDSLHRLYRLIKPAAPEIETIAGVGQLPTESAPTVGSIPATEETFSFLDPARGPGELGWLGAYRILRVLGKGGMGIVFAAEDPQLRREIALKALQPRWAAEPTARQRFLHEARAAAALSDDHIVPIFHVGEHNGMPYIAMPLLPGESLADRLKREVRLPVADVVRIGHEIAVGLAAAHARGLTHRDIKPGNIWLESRHSTENSVNVKSDFPQTTIHCSDADAACAASPALKTYRAKLLDFGLARLDSDQSHVTSTGAILGTPAYMAPEQARGEKADAKSDLFSLGCVLYHACTGQRPFVGNDTMSTLMALAMHTPPPPHTLNAQTPRVLSDLIVRLLSKERDRRPASARAVAAELAILEHDLARTIPPKTTAPPRRRGLGVTVLILVLFGICGYFFAPTIIRVITDKGELIVSVDDPTLQVSVSQAGVVVEEPTTRRRFILSPSEGEIEVLEKDGVSLLTRKFSLTRGGTTRITVTCADLANATKKEPSGERTKTPASQQPRMTDDPERHVAEWVLKRKGQLVLQSADGKTTVNATTIEQLPKAAFQIQSINSHEVWRDKDLQQLTPLKALQSLSLPHPQHEITDVGFERFAQSPAALRLQSLYIGGNQISDAGVAHLRRCAELDHLAFYSFKISNRFLSELRGLNKLVSINFVGPGISDAVLADVSGFPNVVDWGIGGLGVTDAVFYKIASPNLKSLFVDASPRISGRGLRHLNKCTSLQLLTLGMTNVDDAGLAELGTLPELDHLTLTGTKVTDAGLKKLARFPKLHELWLDGTQVGDAGLVELKDVRSLEYLWLDGSKVTDSGLPHLAPLVKLKELHLERTKVTAEGVRKLQAALPKCKIEWSASK